MSSKNKNENEACPKLEDILKIEDKYFIPSIIIIEDKGIGTKLIFVYIGNYIGYTKWLGLPEEKILNLKNLIERDYNGEVINDCVLVPNSYYSKFKGEATLDIRKKILEKCLNTQMSKVINRFKLLENEGTYSRDERSPYLFNRLVLKYIFDTYQSLKIPLPVKYKNLIAVPKDKGYSNKRIFIHPLQEKSEDRDILAEARLIKNRKSDIKVKTKSNNKGGRPPDADVAKKLKALRKLDNDLRNKKGYKKAKVLDILQKEFPSWTKATIETYLKKQK